MSCPECNPVVLGADAYPKNTLQDQPLVLEENCVMGQSGATYCLKDNGDGTAYIDSSVGGRIAAPFAIGYNAEIKAIDDIYGSDSVYVTTDLDNGKTYKIASQSKNTAFDKDAWKGITNIKVPYDIDLYDHNGCHGTDDYWFFQIQPDPITISARGGALFIDDYIVTPELATRPVRDGSYYILNSSARLLHGIDTMRGILNCALLNSSNATEAIQIRSAIAMLESAEPTLFVSKGPYKFHHADIRMTVDGWDITIRSERNDNDQSITDLELTVDPSGFFHVSKTYNVNRLGIMFASFGGLEYATPVNIDSEKRTLYTGLLNQALEQDLSAADRATIKQVIGFINNPPPLPGWMGQKVE